MKAYKSLVKKAISLGYTVSVYDGEEWAVKRSTKQKDIFAAIESVDECELRFRNPSHKSETTIDLTQTADIVGWALVVLGNADDELVADHNTYDESIPSSSKFKWMDDWSDEYHTATV